MIAETLLVAIDDQLRFVLFGLECVLDAEFNVGIVEKIFSDSKDDQVSAKYYVLWTAKRQSVTARVDEYEPGDIWLTLQTPNSLSPSLMTIAERAKYQVYRAGTNQR